MAKVGKPTAGFLSNLLRGPVSYPGPGLIITTPELPVKAHSRHHFEQHIPPFRATHNPETNAHVSLYPTNTSEKELTGIEPQTYSPVISSCLIPIQIETSTSEPALKIDLIYSGKRVLMFLPGRLFCQFYVLVTSSA